MTSVGHWELKPLSNGDRTRRTVLQASSSYLVAADLHDLRRRLVGAPAPRANCCWQSAAHAPSASPQPMGVRRGRRARACRREIAAGPALALTYCSPSSWLGSSPPARCSASGM